MKTSQKSIVYMTVFLLCFGYIISTGPLIPNNFFLRILFLAGILSLFWSLYVMNFRVNVFPELLPNSDLITEGPFSVIRHPIYASIFLALLTLVADEITFNRLLALIATFIILNVKIIHEEKILTREFPDYKNYQKKTSRFIPFLY